MATRIKIENIMTAVGAVRQRKLTQFLSGCSERQRAFLYFVANNPFLTDLDEGLSREQQDEIVGSVKDEEAWSLYMSFTWSLRDLWLKYVYSREQTKKGLCYLTTCDLMIKQAKDAAEACNKALEHIPDQYRSSIGTEQARMLATSSTATMEDTTFGAGFHYDEQSGKVVADVDDVEMELVESIDAFSEFVSEVKAYEAVFTELWHSKTVGKDGDCIFVPLLHTFDQLKGKASFSVYGSIPSYDSMQMMERDYYFVKANVGRWIDGKE